MAILKKYLVTRHVSYFDDIEIDIDIQSPIMEDFEINIDIDFDASITGFDID